MKQLGGCRGLPGGAASPRLAVSACCNPRGEAGQRRLSLLDSLLLLLPLWGRSARPCGGRGLRHRGEPHRTPRLQAAALPPCNNNGDEVKAQFLKLPLTPMPSEGVSTGRKREIEPKRELEGRCLPTALRPHAKRPTSMRASVPAALLGYW
ncbi:unnamed protein product [Lampetra planeri]